MFDDGRFDSLLRKFVIVQNIFPTKHYIIYLRLKIGNICQR